jgi:tRNA-splicing ligase RtcB
MEQVTKRFMNWASILEDSTRAQVQMTSEMPFIFPHIALMPDAHLGKGCAVGAVLPTLGAIMPAAVGVDIGCGMIAVRTQFVASDLPTDRKPLREAIEAAIPLSKGNYNTEILNEGTKARIRDLVHRAANAKFDPESYAANWRMQLGTLGSGNHFIEVSLDEEDRVWLFLHSGSRGIGNKIAVHHIKVAQAQCAKWWINLPDPDLAYLVEGTPEFWAYIRELRWAQHFALLNREEMMDRVIGCFEEWMGADFFPVEESERINCHHNYTVQEKHFGKDVWLSRKGAIDAGKGVPGLIPGSMGTRSYVVEGKGNRLALNSSPHGAGRVYGRKHAQRTFTYDQLAKSMEGIEWSGSAEFLDEIPAAYKSIDVVMADAADLVDVRHTLRQIVNVKGD